MRCEDVEYKGDKTDDKKEEATTTSTTTTTSKEKNLKKRKEMEMEINRISRQYQPKTYDIVFFNL